MMLVFTTAVSIGILFENIHKYAVQIGGTVVVSAFCVLLVVKLFFSTPLSREIVDKYHNDPPEYISKYVEDTTIVPPKYFSSIGMASFLDGADSVSWKKIGASTFEITKSTKAEVDVRFKLQYFPFWWLSEPRMDRVELYGDKSGVLHARLPKGKGTYYLSQVVEGRGTYELLSIMSFSLVVSVLILSHYRDKLLQLLRKVNKFFNSGI
jgi:hypothetical protein